MDYLYKALSILSKNMILQMKKIEMSGTVSENLILISSRTKIAIGRVCHFQKPYKIKLSIILIK